jgi:orotidine-5'-phosphate decarboxylase
LGEALALAERLGPHVGYFKVGLGLFSAEGPAAVRELSRLGRVFLDLKLHDIPATVSLACQAVQGTGASLLTLHASGGRQMMTRARETVGGSVGLLAITVLTSLGDQEVKCELGLSRSARDQVLFLAEHALEAGLDGVVASPSDAQALRDAFGSDFLLVTPGVRPRASDVHDQKRVATPEEAIASGADLLVVGRPILQAPDPLEAVMMLRRQVEEAMRRGSTR